MAKNIEILGGFDDADYSKQLPVVQLPDGSFVEMTHGEYEQFEKLDKFQQQQLLNKLVAADELREYKAMQAAGSDPSGREEWDRVMRFIGRR